MMTGQDVTHGIIRAIIESWRRSCGLLCRRDLVSLTQRLGNNLADVPAGILKATGHTLTAGWLNSDTRPWLELSRPTDEVSIWLLGWRPNDQTDIHDHTQSEAGIYVVQGELFEHVYSPNTEIVENKAFDCQRIDREVYAGSTITVPAPYIHRMGNSRYDGLSLSIHAYLPRLAKMRLFTESELATDGHCSLTTSGVWLEATEGETQHA